MSRINRLKYEIFKDHDQVLLIEYRDKELKNLLFWGQRAKRGIKKRRTYILFLHVPKYRQFYTLVCII